MPNITIDADDLAIDRHQGTEAVVSGNLFGATATLLLRNKWSEFLTADQHMGLPYLRWPGGTAAEDGYFDPALRKPRIEFVEGSAVPPGWQRAYSVSYPELIHPKLIETGGYVGFSEILAKAVADGQGLSVVLPVSEEPTENGTLRQKTLVFLDGLFDEFGGQIARLKEPLVLEIGNEQYATPMQYAAYALEISAAVHEFRGLNPAAQFEVAIQSNNTIEGAATLSGALESSADLAYLAEVSIVRHHFLNIGFNRSQAVEETLERVLPVDALVQSLVAAGRARDSISLYASEISPASGDFRLPGTDERGIAFGLPAAASAASLVSGLVELGYDRATIWGLASSAALNTTTSKMVDGKMVFAPVAEAYRMMAKSLPEMTLVKTPNMDATRGEADHFEFAYVDAAKMVLIVAADDLPADRLDLTYSLRDFGPVGFAWAERIIIDNALSGAATTRREEVDFRSDGVSIVLQKDFDYLQVTIARQTPGDAFLHLWGTSQDDILRAGSRGSLLEGNGGNDSLVGGSGADGLHGGSGSDTLEGGAGGDTLHGGAGDNVLRGGHGSDDIVALAGKDRLAGGTGNDTLNAGAGADVLYGGEGNDRLFGGRDSDALFGDAGSDFINGGHGNDTIYGGDGNDRILGGVGLDMLWGGAGADFFVFKADEALATERIAAIIRDFQPDQDVIDLSEFNAAFARNGDFLASGSAEVRQVSTETMTYFEIDADGNGATDVNIWLSGTLQMFGVTDYTRDWLLL